MAVTIRHIGPDEIEAARRLLLDNGWAGARLEPSAFHTLIESARESLVAIEDGRVVGKLGFRMSSVAMERVRRNQPQAGDQGTTP